MGPQFTVMPQCSSCCDEAPLIHLTSAPSAVSNYSGLSRQNLIAALRPGMLTARRGSECRLPEIPEDERT